MRKMRIYGKAESMTQGIYTFYSFSEEGQTAHLKHLEERLRTYWGMTVDELRREREKLAPHGIFDLVAYLLNQERQFFHSAARRVLDDKLKE